MPTVARPLDVRLLERSVREGDCLIWTGTWGTSCGVICVKGRMESVHRVAYRVWVGPIPPKHDVIRTCGDGDCIEPSHLQAVTRSERMKRQSRSAEDIR